MIDKEKIAGCAKKTFLALRNPFNTVKSVNPLVINKVCRLDEAYYLGVKDTKAIPSSLIDKMSVAGFLRHTTDFMTAGGRAVDIYLKNPLTTSFMSGSSAASALNVFYRINDCAIASDGGGSVLAPAASLNLYSFISPLIASDFVKQFVKTSTDGISFYPSIGFIASGLDILLKMFAAAYPAFSATLKNGIAETSVLLPSQSAKDIYKPSFNYVYEKLLSAKCKIETIETPDIFGERKPLISFLNETVRDGKILISIEGPIDQNGIGDGIYGCFDERTKEIQKKSGKGFLRVVNMAKLTAVGVPLKELGIAAFIICQNSETEIAKAFSAAKTLQTSLPPQVEAYFSNLDMYF